MNDEEFKAMRELDIREVRTVQNVYVAADGLSVMVDYGKEMILFTPFGTSRRNHECQEFRDEAKRKGFVRALVPEYTPSNTPITSQTH